MILNIRRLVTRLKLRYVSNIIRLYVLIGFAVIMNSCKDVVPNSKARFTVTITNVSNGEFATLLSNGVYYTHREGFPLFFTGSFDYGQGLENLAEDGEIDFLLENLASDANVIESGSFIDFFPSEDNVLVFEASYGEFFNFATMHTDTNDGFYSFDEEGLFLFEPDGEPKNGNFTFGVHLWDAGTENNQPPYTGSFQPTRQSAPGEGDETAENVRLLLSDQQFTYPATNEIIQVFITSEMI